MTPRIVSAAFVGACLLGLAPAREARAGIPVYYGYGNEIAHVADLPADHPARQDHPGAALGYRYWRFQVYWCDLWTSKGEFCLYAGNGYMPLGNEAKEVSAKLGLPEASIRRPFFTMVPLGWLILGGIVAVVFVVDLAKKANSPQARAAKLLKRPEYREALEIYRAGPRAQAKAVDFLIGRGIAPKAAESNMALLISCWPAPVPALSPAPEGPASSEGGPSTPAVTP